jgi:hypothetical protein
MRKKTASAQFEGWQTDRMLKARACMIAHNPPGYSPRGWWVREYHSDVAMRNHLAGKKGWEASFADAGAFRTEREARDFAMGFV